METAKHIIIVFALVLFSTATAISEESKISDTRQASCVVQITIDSEIMPLNPEIIKAFVNSSDVMG